VVSGLSSANHAAVIIEEVAHLVPKVRGHQTMNRMGGPLWEEPRLEQNAFRGRVAGIIAMLGHSIVPEDGTDRRC
jgi:hypothetical protein